MARIYLLDDSVIHKIAAGEVVQRPASVLKELVENALDAGASRIVVRIERMGKRFLEVEDDGEGMSRTDALLSIESHATSKIRVEEDIMRVSTLGFRGEALPSIAAVSRMVIRTRRPEDSVGTEIILDEGRIRQVRECGMAAGTLVRVRDLFFNTPARRNFMKTDRTEGFHLFRTFYALSLINLSVHMEVIQDGRRAITLAPANGFGERLSQIWRDMLDQPMTPVDARYRGARLWGVIAAPPFSRARGRGIFFFLNRRWITDKKILRAVFSAYHAVAPKGFVPDGVLCLDLPPNLVDINVHPSKFEVRLADEYAMLGWIQKTVASCLLVQPNPVRGVIEAGVTGEPATVKAPAAGHLDAPACDMESKFQFQSSLKVSEPETPGYGLERAGKPTVRQIRPELKEIPWDYKVLGVVAKTYIVCSYAGGIFIIDKHAAHERLIFERLKRAYRDSIPSQRCLFPQVLSLDKGEVPIFELANPYLKRMGIVLEPFGEGNHRVVSLPKWVKQEEAEYLVRELLQEFAEVPSMDGLSEKADKFLATIACHAASRGQDPVSVPEAYELLEQIVRESVPLSCPHGRSYIYFMAIKDLERIFER